MTWPGRLVSRLDSFQQRNRPAGFVVAVVKKFGDDRAGMLAALMGYYGFLALFPLMLLLVTVLGVALHDNPSLQQRVLDSALSDLPVLGDQIRANIHTIHASPFAVAIGSIGLVWGSLGITQVAQFAMSQVWNLDDRDRPPFVTRLLHGLAFIVALAAGVALTTLLTGLSASGSSNIPLVRVPLLGAGVALNIGLYVAAFRILTPKLVPLSDLVPGAVVAGVGWTLLQFAGAYLVEHQLRHTSQIYGMFAVVLGLISWLFLIAQLTLYAAELNVVRARHLWPRALVAVAEPQPHPAPPATPILRR